MYEDQTVNTPKGKAYVLEVSGGVAYVEMSNGVEMDFSVTDCRDWAEFEAETAAALKAEHDLAIQHNVTMLDQRLRLGEVVLNHIFSGDPKGRAAFTELAKDRLLDRCKTIIATHGDK